MTDGSDAPVQLPDADGLAEALATLPDVAVVVVDRDLRIRFVGGGAHRRHGYVPERMVGRLAADVLPAAAWTALGPLYLRVLAGETVRTRHVAADGTTAYAVTLRPLLRGGRVAGGLVVSRAAAPAPVAHLAAAFADGPVPMALLRDGAVEEANVAMARLLGEPAPALTGRRPEAWAHPEDRDALAATVAAAPAEPREHLLVVAGTTRHVRVRCSRIGEDRTLLHVVDRTAEVLAERAREDALRLFETSFSQAPGGMAVLDLHGRFVRANAAMCRLLGRSEAELLRVRDLDELVHPDDRDAGRTSREAVLAGREGAYEVDKRYLRPDGTVVEARLSVSLVRDADGTPVRVVAQVADLTALNDLRRRAEHLADHDALTGLLNRRRFDEELAREAARLRRTPGGASAVLLLDLDGFKAVNDTLGHAAGDRLLAAVAGALAARVRRSDVLARIGGDEFALLLPDAGDGDADRAAAQLRSTVAEAGRPLPVRVGVSIGAGRLDAVTDPEAALAAADAAMYADKRAHRSRRAAGHG